MTVNRQQSTVNNHQECLYTLDAHQLKEPDFHCEVYQLWIEEK
ncbi:hypothetical protein ACEYW6_14800 [Nostoc sp. UIC 10607]